MVIKKDDFPQWEVHIKKNNNNGGKIKARSARSRLPKRFILLTQARPFVIKNFNTFYKVIITKNAALKLCYF